MYTYKAVLFRINKQSMIKLHTNLACEDTLEIISVIAAEEFEKFSELFGNSEFDITSGEA